MLTSHKLLRDLMRVTLTDNHDVKVKARLHCLLPHLFDDGVNPDVPQQSGPPAGAVGDAVTVAPDVTRTVAHAVAYDGMRAPVARGVTPDGHGDGTGRRRGYSTHATHARPLWREGVGGGGSAHIGGFSGDGRFGSHFWRNYVRHVCRGERNKKKKDINLHPESLSIYKK